IHGIDDHNRQHKGTGSDLEGASEFEILVETLCEEKDISVVAEEFSTEVCEYNNVEASICHQVASRMQLRHIYCDPVSSERGELGIPSQADLVERVKKELGVRFIIVKKSKDYYDQLAAKYHGIREKFWLTKLAPHQGVEDDDMNILCLGGHVVGFSLARELVMTFLGAQFKGAERFLRRLEEIEVLEKGERK
ncbi:MAG: RpiB/LacA/LacB family sugar-phosphate isomerase, partial [Desulfatiglandaceae bacterium]